MNGNSEWQWEAWNGKSASSTINSSQGEYVHINFTNDLEVIRTLVDSFHEWSDNPLDGLEITMGWADSSVIPNSENDCRTLWNNELDIISWERFYEIGASRYQGKFYGSRENAPAAQQLRFRRYAAKDQNSRPEDITAKVMEITKSVIRREFKVKCICESDVTVSKYNGKSCRLH